MEKNKHTPGELIQMLANATKTYYQCSGHLKAHRNEMTANEYKEQLTALNTPIPSDDELLKIGIFNGEGSW